MVNTLKSYGYKVKSTQRERRDALKSAAIDVGRVKVCAWLQRLAMFAKNRPHLTLVYENDLNYARKMRLPVDISAQN